MNIGAGTPQSPRSAACIMLLRNGAGSMEVFLLKRHGLSDVLGGAHVFPGGKLDPSDADWINGLDESPAALKVRLGETDLPATMAAALYVAAIRESFEECGVLFAGALDNVEAGSSWGECMSVLRSPLASSRLVPWSRWITPRDSRRARKHFDTRFFVAELPQGQNPVHDSFEATDGVWLSPVTALRSYWERRIELAPPQIITLAHLAGFRDVAGVLRHARETMPPRIQPELLQNAEDEVICLPGDLLHSERSGKVLGPTRLRWCGGRYEPEGGLEALFP